MDVAAEDAIHLSTDGVVDEGLSEFLKEVLEFADASFEPVAECLVVTRGAQSGPTEPGVAVEEFVVSESGQERNES